MGGSFHDQFLGVEQVAAIVEFHKVMAVTTPAATVAWAYCTTTRFTATRRPCSCNSSTYTPPPSPCTGTVFW